MATTTNWQGISADALAYVTWSNSSCIHEDQELVLANGRIMTAGQVASMVEVGLRVDFLTEDLTGKGECYNPVVGVLRTRAPGVRIVFTDGRSVSLTIGHVLPAGERTVDVSPGWGAPIGQQEICFAGDLRPGMWIMDGLIAEVHDLGEISAVRLWTAHPAWIHAKEGLAIGTRWHEILHAWVLGEDIDPDEPEYYSGSRLEGWVWVLPTYKEGGKHEPLYERGGKPLNYDSRGHDIPMAILGDAWTIREVFRQRATLAIHPYHWGEGWAIRDETDRPPLAHAARSAQIRLVWSNPDQLTDILVSGKEVVSEPVVVAHRQAVAA